MAGPSSVLSDTMYRDQPADVKLYLESPLRARGGLRARRRPRAPGAPPVPALARLVACRIRGRPEAPGAGVALAAVDDDVGAGDPRRAPGQQEGDHVGDLLQAPQPPERELGTEEGGEVGRVLLREPLP